MKCPFTAFAVTRTSPTSVNLIALPTELMAHIGDKLGFVLACDLEVFDRVGEFTCARLDFLKQPCVLYRDHSLVREGVDELDLAFGKRAHFGAPDRDYANCLACVD